MNKCIISLLATRPILNIEKSRVFEKMSPEYSVYFNSLLYSNWIEVLSSMYDNSEIILCLDEEDKDSMPRNFITDRDRLVFLGSAGNNFRDYYRNLFLREYSKFIFINFNSIGITSLDLQRVSDLLTMPDKTFVAGRSVDDRVSLFASNCKPESKLEEIFIHDSSYQDFLKNIIAEDIFLHTIGNFLSINNFEDFKKLYIELSKKESLAYCSETMHERFNDIFIEYKEFLDE